MLPTIYPRGEMILVEKFTHLLYGIEGDKRNGYNAAYRCEVARCKQKEWARHCTKHDTSKQGGTGGSTGQIAETKDGRQVQKHNEEQNRTEKQEEEKEGEETWYASPQPAVNQLPPKGAWKRLWKRLTSGIEVGDVIVLHHPEKDGTVCKRVLGLPGDVVIRHGYHPHIHSVVRLKERRGGNFYYYDEDDDDDISNNNKSKGLIVVPNGHLWVEGDNSLNSFDSRQYGPVPASLVVGKVVCRIWPLRGSAMMERGGRPILSDEGPFTGSTVLPAGYEGETIVKKKKEA